MLSMTLSKIKKMDAMSTAVAALSWILIGTSTALAAPPRLLLFGGPPPRPPHMEAPGKPFAEKLRDGLPRHIAEMLDKIDVTEQQRDAVKRLLAESATKIRELQEQHRFVDVELATILAEDALDERPLATLKTTQLDATQQLAAAAFDLNVQLAEIFTPEQRRQLLTSTHVWRISRHLREHLPPKEALDSCAGLVDGVDCEVSIGGDNITGKCHSPPSSDGPLACIPDGLPPRPPQAEVP